MSSATSTAAASASAQNSAAAAPLTDLQQTVATKMETTVSAVAMQVIRTLISGTKLTPQDFVVTHIMPMKSKLASLDDRTSNFFQAMMDPVNKRLMALPMLDQSFQKFAKSMNDSDIQRKLTESIALPYVKNLLVDLDKIKPSIVDDIIASNKKTV